jgi:hypothetical protein
MSSVTQNPEAATDWQQEIRALEERDRVAFLAGDTSTLDAMWDDRLLVNSPLNVVNDRGGFSSCLAVAGSATPWTRSGSSRSPATANTLTHRRFTNIWQLQDGAWRMIARHAQVIAPR